MKYSIKYKSLDGKDITLNVKIFEFLEGINWVADSTSPEEIEYLSPNEDEYIMINLVTKELEMQHVVVKHKPGGDRSMSFRQMIPIPDHILRFFDNLDFKLSSNHTRQVNQKIHDWWQTNEEL